MNIELSVIIPIYNVEAYLRECLDSLLAQEYTDYEAILVDDGSTDGSGDIAEEYAAADGRFRALHQSNGGLSAARNAGLAAARGRYVCFIDSDDYVEADYLSCLYEVAARTDADMVIADYHEVGEHGERLNRQKSGTPLAEGRQEQQRLLRYLADVGECHYATAVVVAWNKLIRTEITRRHLYPEGLLHEDEQIIMPLLMDCAHVEWTGADVYAYRQRSGSIMQRSDEAMRHLTVLDAYRRRIAPCRHISRELYGAMERAYIWNLTIWYYLMRTQYHVSARRLYVFFSSRMWEAVIRYGRAFDKSKRKEYLIFAVCPEYFLKHYFE